MKHFTHIYIAAKAIEFTSASIDNLKHASGRSISGNAKTKERIKAKERHRMLDYYRDQLFEASWAPDDVLSDNDPYHIFKLFTDDDFDAHGLEDKPCFEREGVKYYKFGGGLPYRIDHIAQEIISMAKLRNHNDQFSMKQICYYFLLLSHYISDAHVPMHCDLRDDPPTAPNNGTQPSRRHSGSKPVGEYLDDDAHGDLEEEWENAVIPVALEQEIISDGQVYKEPGATRLSQKIDFDRDSCKKDGPIEVRIIPDGGLMDFVIDICIDSKKRSNILFPKASPVIMDEDVLSETTRDIFADAIGNHLSIWRYIWERI